MTNSPPPPPPLFYQPSSPSFTSVPDEIVANCLARISKTQYRSLSSVSKSFHSVLSSPEIYAARSQIGATEPRLYLCLRLSTAPRHRWFTLRTPDQTLSNGGKFKRKGCDEIRLSLVPVKISSSYACAQSNAAIVAVGSEIYDIGGSYENKRCRAVSVLDCRSHTQRLVPDMTMGRWRPKVCFLDGKIYVMGGCRKRDEPMNWGEVLDIKTQTWNPLPSPSGDEFDRKHKVVVFGARIYVITKHDKYAYDPKEGRWLLETGFVGLERIVKTSRHWCVIENLVFHQYCDDKLWWYDLSCEKWLMVEGLTDLYMKRDYDYRTIQLANYGGKLMIVWKESPEHCSRGKKTWFAVIRLEKRLTCSGSEIWGEIERLGSLGRWSYHELLTCVSVSL